MNGDELANLKQIFNEINNNDGGQDNKGAVK